MRTIRDGSFNVWEAYATTGDFGFSDPARIVFRCLTDPGERARAVSIDGSKSDAEAQVGVLTDDDLKALLAQAVVVN